VFRLNESGLSREQLASLSDIQAQLMARAARPDMLDPLARADREDELVEWIEAQGIDQGWELAPMFVRAQLTVDELEALKAEMGPAPLRHALAWLEGMISVVDVLRTIEQSAE